MAETISKRKVKDLMSDRSYLKESEKMRLARQLQKGTVRVDPKKPAYL